MVLTPRSTLPLATPCPGGPVEGDVASNQRVHCPEDEGGYKAAGCRLRYAVAPQEPDASVIRTPTKKTRMPVVSARHRVRRVPSFPATCWRVSCPCRRRLHTLRRLPKYVTVYYTGDAVPFCRDCDRLLRGR